MSSIFLDSFHRNLQRINSSVRPGRMSAEPARSANRNFNELLKTLSADEKAINNDGLPPRLRRMEPRLSNLQSFERPSAKQLNGAPELPGKAELNAEQSPAKLPNLDVPAVKKPALEVKASAPEAGLSPVQLSAANAQLAQVKGQSSAPGAESPVAKAVSEAPAAPMLLGAKRLAAETYAKNSSVVGSVSPKEFEPKQIAQIISLAGEKHGVNKNLSLAVARAESSFRADAVSSDGNNSKGVFQLLDSTGLFMREQLEVKDDYDPFNPHLNAYLGVGYLKRLQDIFSEKTQLTPSLRTTPAASPADLEKIVVAAFNAGEGNVTRAQLRASSLGKDPAQFNAIEPHLPDITRTYVQRVFDFKDAYERG